MSAKRRTNWWRGVLMGGCAMGALGLVTVGSAQAQPGGAPGPQAAQPAAAAPQAAAGEAGGLDMDVNPSAPVAATSQPGNQPGGLDTDVNPTASVAASAAAPALSHNVQDGIVYAPMAPAPGSTPPAASGSPPVTPPSASPPAPASVAGPATAPPDSTQAAFSIPGPSAMAEQPLHLEHPTVINTAKLASGETTVTLYGIEGLQGEAAQNLQGFLTANDSHLACQPQAASGFVCLLPDGTDVAQVALVNGAARAKDDAPESYREQEEAAQAARRGLWANLPPPPATLRHPMVQDTATLVADHQTYALNGLQGLGQPYASQLQGYIAANGDSLICNPQGVPGQYICVTSDGTDLAKVALVNGAAVVASDAPDAYRVQQADALNNHRGVWVNPPQDLLMASAADPDTAEYMLVAGDDGADGIVYVGGEPTAVIDGVSEFLVYGGDAGWGYYDQGHHWHDAPDQYRRHLEHFHPGGHGLRGYGHDLEAHHEMALRHEEAMRHDGGLRHADALHRDEMLRHDAAIRHDEGLRREEGVRREEAIHREEGVRREAALHPAGGMHPGGVPGAAHPGFGAPHPGGFGGGFVRPPPSAAGFHPGGMATAHAAAPAAHVAAPSGGAKHK
jgi:endonuclease YncB( thermonuclease family)